ncbi:hypothetical protein C5748_08060 [Phyllobacterium phragmitis]|uniref:Transglycosylase SLT domain-containing protein n=1 Tax=Phyllobacterium phragmitis TaxID=2670329 RepID=A0A2S9ITG7_9HYPH|nr:lytic transglycosylase domain-containing protein [Phyllobacterium phragmitis]PRD43815.1 hypothetical protein C5748_08060 [Phyllobacterium phragmitis]
MRDFAISGILAGSLMLLPSAHAQEVASAAVAPPLDVNGRITRAFEAVPATLPRPAIDATVAALRPDAGCPPADGESVKKAVRAIAREEGVDPDMADAVAWVESHYGTIRQPSPAGAVGIMQLMPQTAKEFGVTDRCDIEANIRGGIRYLKQLGAEFRDPLLVLAAYNAGPANIYKKRGIPEFSETENYIVKVLNRWKFSTKPAAANPTIPEPINSQNGEATTDAWKDGHVIEVE